LDDRLMLFLLSHHLIQQNQTFGHVLGGRAWWPPGSSEGLFPCNENQCCFCFQFRLFGS